MSGDAPDPPQEETASETDSGNSKVGNTATATGPAKFVSEANGFLSFKTGLKSTATVDIDEAIKIRSEHIECAFINHWDRHANIEINRPHDVLRRQAYELSFGHDEKKRIRDSLPADLDVLDVIECFGTQILLENFSRYLAKRRKYFRDLSSGAPLVSAVIVILFGLLGLYLLDGWPFVLNETTAKTADTFFVEKITQLALPGLLFAVAFVIVGAGITRLGWSALIADKLNTERTYYAEIVKGSTSRVKSYLSSLQRSFATLSVSAQKQLTDIKRREDDFVGKATKYVRLIVWFPVRLEMIEIFYRATIDSYMELSAKQVLAADLGIFARMQLRWYAVISVLVTTAIIVLDFILGTQHAIFVPIAIAALSIGCVVWPQREDQSSAYYIPKDFSGFQFEVFRRRAWGILVGSLPAALGAIIVLIGVAESPRLWLDAKAFDISPWPAVILANVAVVCVVLLQNLIAWLIYVRRETRTLYNGNVADTIVQEMNSADWAAFNELRSDQKMAEIYESVFSALQEEKKARR